MAFEQRQSIIKGTGQAPFIRNKTAGSMDEQKKADLKKQSQSFDTSALLSAGLAQQGQVFYRLLTI
jgi:hypothetical protein